MAMGITAALVPAGMYEPVFYAQKPPQATGNGLVLLSRLSKGARAGASPNDANAEFEVALL